MQDFQPVLKSTLWLSVRLDLSIRTIERLRATNPDELPPHLVIGNSIRYDEMQVEAWIKERLCKAIQAVRSSM